MDELIKSVAQRANISNDAAKIAIDVIVSQLKTRLPAPLASQIDSVLAGGNVSSDLTKDAESLLGGFLNQK